MITVVPVAIPITLPEASTDAMDGLLLLQVPPGVASVRLVDVPEQIPVTPVIAETPGFTVSTVVTKHAVAIW